MTAPASLLASTSVCPRCGTGLRCGMVAGDAECWCVQRPHVMPVPATQSLPLQPDNSAASCYCPACLEQITDERQQQRQQALSPAPD